MNAPVLLTPSPTRVRLEQWSSVLADDSSFASVAATTEDWKAVTVPHNWDDYHGYHAVSHGNLHGTAWYRTWFEHSGDDTSRIYAYFEGVGSYATVYVNGHEAGKHAGGRTTFTIDLTDYLVSGANLLAVKAEHPEKIDDLPFVCGGCWGAPNTEGSQPIGIFRPVWLEQTGPVRVQPFGVHVLTPTVTKAAAQVTTRNSLCNPSGSSQQIRVEQDILGPDDEIIAQESSCLEIAAHAESTLEIHFDAWKQPKLWSPRSPLLHRVVTRLLVDDQVSHETDTAFGLRWVEWPHIEAPDADHNVVSADRRGALISNGDEPRSEGNNGLTSIVNKLAEAPVCLAPMGVVVRQLPTCTLERADLQLELSFEGSATSEDEVQVLCEIQNEGGTVFFHQYRQSLAFEGAEMNHTWVVPSIHYPHRWNPNDPYLHRVLIELRSPEGELWERSETLFGIRPITWDTTVPLNLARPQFETIEESCGEEVDRGVETERRLLINGEPVFLHGTCEYETMLGCDHAFTDEQIDADVTMMLGAGFNAFRDAHHPHNLRYYDHWDHRGILCWTQMGSHIWFDNPGFRENYKQLVREWVIERRNHPSVIIWGLQNESSMPEAFAAELRDIIRELDPTSPEWRITTTCNGGKGSDWNVPQEWCGTYGGNSHDYDLKRCQMVGEYGAWRNFGVHTECAYSGDENDRSESWACAAMEIKLRLGDAAKDEAIGHFHWVFNSFPNPGRSPDNYEGPGNGEIGSINNKGLVTAWHQPSDLYYMFRSNYADVSRDPMVYIASHTWPERWKSKQPRKVHVYSNCEEVELFNGIGTRSYGCLKHPGRGFHFEWPGILPATNLLYAVGYRKGKRVAEDLIRLEHLPADSSEADWVGEIAATDNLTKDALYRVNCGSEQTFLDVYGNTWLPDQVWNEHADWGWESWASHYDNVPDDLASRGIAMTPVRGTALQELHRTYRYGRNFLKYRFRTGAGRFQVRCHFSEAWFGVGGFKNAEGLRLFDIAINGETVESDLDLWRESGGKAHTACIRSYDVNIDEDILHLEFPRVAANNALICAIEIFPA